MYPLHVPCSSTYLHNMQCTCPRTLYFHVILVQCTCPSSHTCDLDLYTLLLIHATHNNINVMIALHWGAVFTVTFQIWHWYSTFSYRICSPLHCLADLQGMQDGSTPANVKLQLLQYSTSINGDQESNWCNSERIQTHLVACMDIPTILPYFSLLVILSTFFYLSHELYMTV